MIAVVSGSRTITDYDTVALALERAWYDITEVWHGDQSGVMVLGQYCETVDRLAGRWAKANHLSVRPFPADWTRYGKSAGPRRNQVMADEAARCRENVFLVTVWDGSSTGTADCCKRFKAHRVPVFEYNRALGCYNFWTPK